MKLRKVVVYKWQRVANKSYNEKVFVGNGLFHQFGVDYEEFETGPGNFTTGIIEMPDGSVESVPVGLFIFNN